MMIIATVVTGAGVVFTEVDAYAFYRGGTRSTYGAFSFQDRTRFWVEVGFTEVDAHACYRDGTTSTYATLISEVAHVLYWGGLIPVLLDASFATTCA